MGCEVMDGDRSLQMANPYSAPRALLIAPEDNSIRCSFCERPHQETGPLVVDAHGNCYLCAACAKIAAVQLETLQPLSWASPTLAVILILAALAIVLWDTAFSTTPTFTVKQLFIGAAALAAWFLITEIVPKRWRGPNGRE